MTPAQQFWFDVLCTAVAVGGLFIVVNLIRKLLSRMSDRGRAGRCINCDDDGAQFSVTIAALTPVSRGVSARICSDCIRDPLVQRAAMESLTSSAIEQRDTTGS